MIYQLKALLKNKLTLTFFTIILILNLYTVISLETMGTSSNNRDIIYIEKTKLITEKTLESEKGYIQSIIHDPEIKILYDNYFKYKEWLIGNYEKLSEMIQDTNSTQYSKEMDIIYIMESMAVLDCNANPDSGRPFSQDIYKEDLKKLGISQEFPFDSTILHLIENSDEEEKATVYNGNKIHIDRMLDILHNNQRRLETGTSSPWTFYVQKVGIEKFSVPTISIICLIYASAIVIEERKNRSIQLIALVPENKSYLFEHYYIKIIISVLIILIISFLIPILIIGIRHGFDGLRNPILVDPNGFLSFKGYEHINKWNFLGLGKFSNFRNTEYGILPSNQLKFFALWKVIGLSMIPAILKLLFIVLLGVGIGLCISNVMVSILVSSLTAIIYLLFQLYGENILFNPLSISSSWNTTIGATPFTWLRAIIVLIVSLSVMGVIILIINKKKDFNV